MYTHTNKHSHTTNLSIRGSSLGRVVPGFRALCWMHYKNMYTVNQPLQCNTTLHYDYYCTWNVLWMSGLNSILGFSASCLFPSSSLCQHKRCPNNTRDTRLSMVLRETDRITCFYSENFTGVPSTGNLILVEENIVNPHFITLMMKQTLLNHRCTSSFKNGLHTLYTVFNNDTHMWPAEQKPVHFCKIFISYKNAFKWNGWIVCTRQTNLRTF